MSKNYTANDMRSMVKNSNSSHYKAAMDNHSNQMNSNNTAYWSSRSTVSNVLDEFYDTYFQEQLEIRLEFDIDKKLEEIKNYIEVGEKLSKLSQGSAPYNTVRQKLPHLSLAEHELHLIVQSNENDDIIKHLIPFIKFNNTLNHLYSCLPRYSQFNKETFDVYIYLLEVSIKRSYSSNSFSSESFRNGIEEITKDFLNDIIKHNPNINRVEFDKRYVDFTKIMYSKAFNILKTFILGRNLELARRLQEYMQFNEKIFSQISDNIQKLSLYNIIPDDDDWFNYLVSIGAPASTRELTLILRRCIKSE